MGSARSARARRGEVERAVGDQAVDAAPLVLQLPHRLLERRALDADQVGGRHPHVGVEDLAEVAVGRHVLDGPDLDAGRVHRDDDLADAGVRWALGRGPADQVAVVGHLAEAGPDLLAVDDEVVAVALGPGLQRGEVGAGLGLAHPDAPRGLAGQDAGEQLADLLGRAVGHQRRAHLPVGEPRRGEGRTGRDHLLGHDQPLDRRPAAPAELDRPGHADPAVRGELAGELA